MAMSHGLPEYPIVMIPMGRDIASIVDGSYFDAVGGEGEIDRLADEIISMWLHGSLNEEQGR